MTYLAVSARFNRVLIVLAAAGALLCGSSIGQTPRKQQETPEARKSGRKAYEVTVNAVVLDVVVTDKKGRIVKDLTTGDLEVFEDGVRQKIKSFHQIEDQAEPQTASRPTPAPYAPPVLETRRPSLNLITLVFDRISLYGRKMARESGMKYVRELQPNDVVSVMVIDRTLRVLCPYTKDPKRLQAAIELATGGTSQQFAKVSGEIQEAMETAGAALEGAEAGAAAAGRETGGPSAGTSAAFAEAKTEAAVVDMLRHASVGQETIQGHATVDGLKTIVRGLREFPGRKAVVFFAERIALPIQVLHRFQDLVSMANRQNVSFYCMDTKGLEEQVQLGDMSGELERLSGISKRQIQKRGGEGVTREEVFLAENVNNVLTMSDQNSLAQLAEGTGGVLVTNANDLLPGLQKVSEDLHSHYELTYSPSNQVYNGDFRKVEIRLKRPDLTVRSREGYYALPDNELAESPYEIPLYEALNAPEPVSGLSFRTASLVFPTSSARSDVLLYLEAPLAYFTFERQNNQFSSTVDLMVAVRNSAGRIIEKFSQDFPISGPAAKEAETSSRNFVFYRTASLGPGKYTVEAVIRDPKSQKTALKRAVLIIPDRSGSKLQVSSVVIVKRLNENPPDVELRSNPLTLGDRMVIPNLKQPLRMVDWKNLAFYFLVRGDAKEKVLADVVLSKNGEAFGHLGDQELPAPDERGESRYFATVPLSSFEPGTYEVEVIARQGESTARSRASFEVK